MLGSAALPSQQCCPSIPALRTRRAIPTLYRRTAPSNRKLDWTGPVPCATPPCTLFEGRTQHFYHPKGFVGGGNEETVSVDAYRLTVDKERGLGAPGVGQVECLPVGPAAGIVPVDIGIVEQSATQIAGDSGALTRVWLRPDVRDYAVETVQVLVRVCNVFIPSSASTSPPLPVDAGVSALPPPRPVLCTGAGLLAHVGSLAGTSTAVGHDGSSWVGGMFSPPLYVRGSIGSRAFPVGIFASRSITWATRSGGACSASTLTLRAPSEDRPIKASMGSS